MSVDHKSRRIAVLGGAGGIGRELVLSLKVQGHEVVVLDLARSLERHAPPVPAFEIDVLSESATQDTFAALKNHWQSIDGFVNLAGYNASLQPLSQTPLSEFDDIGAGNLRGAFIAAKACLPMMSAGSAMVTVSSGLAQNIRPGYGAYAVAKAGLIALTKTLAVENAPHVRVNAVAPALVDTAFLRGGTGRSDEGDQAQINMEAYRAAIPMKRLAEPKDIVGPIEFLLSDASAYMTGQVLWINGGGYMP